MTAASLLWHVLLGIALLGTFSSTIFLFMVLIAAMRWRRGARAARQAAAATPESSLPAVTIFKPVHGMEAQLEENLESFFQQDYPSFEIVLGARDANDAGLQLAEKDSPALPADQEPDRRLRPTHLAQCQSLLAEQDDSGLEPTIIL